MIAMAIAMAGCASSTPSELAKESAEDAKQAATQGEHCKAAELDPSTRYEQECVQQKDREAKQNEDHEDVEEIREGERLEREGR